MNDVPIDFEIAVSCCSVMFYIAFANSPFCCCFHDRAESSVALECLLMLVLVVTTGIKMKNFKS